MEGPSWQLYRTLPALSAYDCRAAGLQKAWHPVAAPSWQLFRVLLALCAYDSRDASLQKAWHPVEDPSWQLFRKLPALSAHDRTARAYCLYTIGRKSGAILITGVPVGVATGMGLP